MRVKFIGKDGLSYFDRGKEYDVESYEHGWYRIFDETDEDNLFPTEFFEIVEGSISDVPHFYPPELKLMNQNKQGLPDDDAYEKYYADIGEDPAEYKQRIIQEHGLMEELFSEKDSSHNID